MKFDTDNIKTSFVRACEHCGHVWDPAIPRDDFGHARGDDRREDACNTYAGVLCGPCADKQDDCN